MNEKLNYALNPSEEILPNPKIKFTIPYEGKHFLTIKLAREISCLKTDTLIRRIYEIETPDGTEVWIERNVYLNGSRCFYQLFPFNGSN
jgi:hypothetical protein